MAVRKINVISYAGYRNEEAPRTFFIDDERIDVIEVVRAWREEGSDTPGIRRYFTVKGSDGYQHRLFYDERSGDWYLD